MECLILLMFILKTVSAGVSPIYSPSYSMVSYGGVSSTENQTSNHPESHPKEAVKSLEDVKTPERVYPTSDTLIPNEITIEPESEQIDFVFFPKTNENIELLEETDDHTEGQMNPKTADQSPSNEEGVYYVYHPNGLLQKVVFATRSDPGNGQYTAKLNYQNVEPIVEPIYTYDPNTFVFQRLQLLKN